MRISDCSSDVCSSDLFPKGQSPFHKISACAGWKGGSPVSLRRLQISSGSTDRSLMLRPRASWRWQGWEFQTGKNSVRDALCGTPNPDQRLVDISDRKRVV